MGSAAIATRSLTRSDGVKDPGAMLAAQAREISRLSEQVRKLEEALAAQKEMTSDALDREAALLADQHERGRLQ
jgi:hypothetical protein